MLHETRTRRKQWAWATCGHTIKIGQHISKYLFSISHSKVINVFFVFVHVNDTKREWVKLTALTNNQNWPAGKIILKMKEKRQRLLKTHHCHAYYLLQTDLAGQSRPQLYKRVDNAIHQINLFLLNSAILIGFLNTYPSDSDLSGGSIALSNVWTTGALINREIFLKTELVWPAHSD